VYDTTHGQQVVELVLGKAHVVWTVARYAKLMHEAPEIVGPWHVGTVGIDVEAVMANALAEIARLTKALADTHGAKAKYIYRDDPRAKLAEVERERDAPVAAAYERAAHEAESSGMTNEGLAKEPGDRTRQSRMLGEERALAWADEILALLPAHGALDRMLAGAREEGRREGAREMRDAAVREAGAVRHWSQLIEAIAALPLPGDKGGA
jgi:hypothetical protein